MFADPETNRRRSPAKAPSRSRASPRDFAAFVRAEIKKWDEVGKAANIEPTE